MRRDIETRKGNNMIDETLQELIAFVKDASPMLWEAASQRVRVVIIADLSFAILLFAVSYAIYRRIVKMREVWEGDSYGGEKFALFIASIVCLTSIGLFNLYSGLMWAFSPQYATLHFLTELIK
jgi:hypothetical protein